MKSITKVQKFNQAVIRITIMLMIGIFTLGFSGLTWAQNEIYAESFISSDLSQAQISSILNQELTLSFEEVPILEALEQIADAGSLELNYNKRNLNTDVLISRQFTEMNLYVILEEITSSADMYFYITESGQLILTPVELPSNSGTIRGKIVDAETEEPIIGATVFIVEMESGTAADASGEFEFESIPEGTYTFQISSIGYQSTTQTIAVGADQELDVVFVLESDVTLLDEVVVTGYNVQQRSIPTGSLTRIEGTEFRETLIQSPDQALQGRMSGVMASHASGQPGRGLQVRVRGLGSINATNAPLYIVDGVQVRTGYVAGDDVTNARDHWRSDGPFNALSGINPNDIENIEVLKDASATAMYGAQGANGVVLITTRQARRGQTQINISSQTGFNEQPNKLNVMDGPTWTETMIQGYVNYYVDRGEDPEVRRQMAIDRYGDPATAPTYDWQDAIFRAGVLQKLNVSATAGLENTRVFLSGSYDYEQGAVLASDFSSLKFRSNIDHSFSDRFTVASRLSLASSTANGVVSGSANILSPFHGGYTQRPIDAIYDEDGGYNHNDFIRVNLVQLLNENIRTSTTRQLRGSLTGIYQFLDNLSFRTLWAVDYRTVRDRTYTSALLPRYLDVGGSLTERYRETLSFNTNQIIEFEESYNQHTINLLGGFEYKFDNFQDFSASGEQFPNPAFTQLDLAAIESGVSGSSTESKFAGVFSRADYNYLERYFVSANIRYDGSSRFGQQNQWGLFYSGALAWDLAREQFMERFDFINQLKLRTSLGITGNSGISDFAARSLFGSGGTYDGNTGLRPSGLGNDLLTWEEAQTLDIGVQFSALNDRFYGDINWFNTRNKNLLLNAFLPTDSGYSSITRNAGVVENTGWEIELGARWIATNTFNWSTNFNMTYQKNEIIELVDDLDILGSSTRVGQPIDLLWHYDYAGVNPADGRVFWYDVDGHLTYIRSSSNLKAIGSYSPDFFGGLTNLFNFQNFSLRTFFQYEYGRTTYDSTVGRRMHTVSTERGLNNRLATQSWQNPGDMVPFPRFYISSSFPGSSSHYNSSVFIRDASYIRLKEIVLSYNVPNEWVSRVGLSNANIFVQGRNILTWTNYPWGDPEFVGQGTGAYPQSRQFSLGINLEF